MKRQILTFAMLAASFISASAQEHLFINDTLAIPVSDVKSITHSFSESTQPSGAVTEDVLAVELKSTGKTVKVTSRHSATDEKDNVLNFRLIGAKGKRDVHDYYQDEIYHGDYYWVVELKNRVIKDFDVDNADIFAHVSNVRESGATVELQKNTSLLGDYDNINYGLYISKKPDLVPTFELNLSISPWVRDSILAQKLMNGECLDVQNLDIGVEDTCYTHSFKNIYNLENNTTYYIRPYVNISTPDGPGKMFGSTESFTTLYYTWTVINNETYYRSKFYDYNSTDALLSKDAVDAFCKKYADRVGEGEISRQIVIKSWIDFLAKNPDLMETMKALNSTKKEECTDGIAYLVSAVPVEYEAVLLEDMLSGTVVTDFDASLNEETDVTGWSQPWASAGYGEHKWVETDSNPYGGYYLLEPYSDTSTAKYAFELPKLFVPGKYNIYITFAQGIGEEDVQKNKFTAFAFEYNMNLGGYLNSQLIAEDEHADGKNIIIDTTNGCDTICLTADLAGKIIIQFQPGGKTAELRQGIYTKTMRIAEIKVVPAETK